MPPGIHIVLWHSPKLGLAGFRSTVVWMSPPILFWLPSESLKVDSPIRSRNGVDSQTNQSFSLMIHRPFFFCPQAMRRPPEKPPRAAWPSLPLFRPTLDIAVISAISRCVNDKFQEKCFPVSQKTITSFRSACYDFNYFFWHGLWQEVTPSPAQAKVIRKAISDAFQGQSR